MAFRMFLAALALVGWLQAFPATAADALTPDQKKAVEEVVRTYLRENPEVVIEAIQALRAKQEAEERRMVQEALAKSREELERDPDTPVTGNPDGDVTVVEFFDYQCGYCKRVLPVLQDFIEADGKVRLVLKELPILSEQSLAASRMALAVWRLDKSKYADFHAKLMALRGSLAEERVMKLATDMGLDKDALTKAAKDPWVDRALARNRQLAQSLGITGTPGFVIGDHLIPGALDRKALEEVAAQVRAK